MGERPWAAFVMPWERPPRWRFLRFRRWLERHRRIWFLELDLGLHDVKIGGNYSDHRWLWD